MAQEIDFADPEIKALESWLKRSLASMSSATAAEPARTVDIGIQGLGLKTEEEIRGLVPADGLSWGVHIEEAAGSILVVAGRKTALALSRPDGDEEGGLATRLADEAAFSDDEKTAMAAAQTLLGQALVEAMKSACSADTLGVQSDVIEGSAWASGEDPVAGESILVAEIEIKLAGDKKEAGLVLLTPALIREHFAKALESQAGGSGGGDFIFYPASSAMKDKIFEQMGQTPQECETVAELMRGFLDDNTGGAVIGVGSGEEHILSLLRGMKELPDCGEKRVIVVLENPSTSNVVRCGRLGLFSVLPPEFAAQDFHDKISRPE